MITARVISVLVMVMVLTVNCGGPPHRVNPAEIKKPLAVIVEKEITGIVKGQKLSYPMGVAVDIIGNVFITDTDNNRLIKFSPQLEPILDIGGYGGMPGLFDRPSYLVVDRNLNLAISDEGNKRICRYNSDLVYADDLELKDDEDPLKYGDPSGIAFLDYGEAWVAERSYDRLSVFDNIGEFQQYIGEFGYSGGQLASPEKIYKDKKGDLIVCDAGNSRLVRYDSFGTFIDEISVDGFEYPMALTIDKNYMWVVDGASGKLFCFYDYKTLIFQTGPTLQGSIKALKEPSDIAVLKDGRLIITDSGNNRILICRIMFES